MSDLAKWKVHGPVHSVKRSYAEWDLAEEEWQAAADHGQGIFRPDGKLEEVRYRNPDGTVTARKNLYNEIGLLVETQCWKGDSLEHQTIYSYGDGAGHVSTISVNREGHRREEERSTYDSLGRKTTVRFLHPPEGAGHVMYWIEAADQGVTAPGVVTMTTAYDANDLVTEVRFHDAQNAVVTRVRLARDEAGRLVKTELLFGDRLPFSETAAEAEKPSMPKAEVLAKVFGPSQALSITTYSYNENGLRVERTIRMGLLGGERTAFRYDNHGNPIEESRTHENREYGSDEQGELHITKEYSDAQHTRYEYQYDAHGNWTERVIWSRQEPNPNFERRNVERREIVYYPLAVT
ncbi:MAG TPA: hypothetical protein VH640_29505 [Bryobacteraceae bacterium]|jgi:hypothetical protein